MPEFNIPYGFRPLNPEQLDKRFGPYVSLTEAIRLTEGVRVAGLKIGVIEGDAVRIYTVQPDLQTLTLESKPQVWGGISGDIEDQEDLVEFVQSNGGISPDKLSDDFKLLENGELSLWPGINSVTEEQGMEIRQRLSGVGVGEVIPDPSGLSSLELEGILHQHINIQVDPDTQVESNSIHLQTDGTLRGIAENHIYLSTHYGENTNNAVMGDIVLHAKENLRVAANRALRINVGSSDAAVNYALEARVAGRAILTSQSATLSATDFLVITSTGNVDEAVLAQGIQIRTDNAPIQIVSKREVELNTSGNGVVKLTGTVNGVKSEYLTAGVETEGNINIHQQAVYINGMPDEEDITENTLPTIGYVRENLSMPNLGPLLRMNSSDQLSVGAPVDAEFDSILNSVGGFFYALSEVEEFNIDNFQDSYFTQGVKYLSLASDGTGSTLDLGAATRISMTTEGVLNFTLVETGVDPNFSAPTWIRATHDNITLRHAFRRADNTQSHSTIIIGKHTNHNSSMIDMQSNSGFSLQIGAQDRQETYNRFFRIEAYARGTAMRVGNVDPNSLSATVQSGLNITNFTKEELGEQHENGPANVVSLDATNTGEVALRLFKPFGLTNSPYWESVGFRLKQAPEADLDNPDTLDVILESCAFIGEGTYVRNSYPDARPSIRYSLGMPQEYLITDSTLPTIGYVRDELIQPTISDLQATIQSLTSRIEALETAAEETP